MCAILLASQDYNIAGGVLQDMDIVLEAAMSSVVTRVNMRLGDVGLQMRQVGPCVFGFRRTNH